MKQGFTLMELMVIIIIIGILATIGLSQYEKVVERGRAAEAKTILGDLRTVEEAFFLENDAYTDNMALLAVEAPQACTPTHYFRYSLALGGLPDTFTATATRCTAGEGGKVPAGSIAYQVILDEAGFWDGTAGYY